MYVFHQHYYYGLTDYVFHHQHRYSGLSSFSPDSPGHIHEISDCSTKDNEHVHYCRLTTGPDIDISGGHIHSYWDFTSCDQEHRHTLSGHTSVNGRIPAARSKFTVAEARQIGEQLGINWGKSRFNTEQFRIGLEVELEHGRKHPNTNVTNDDPLTTGKIALAHLNEFPDYYVRLSKMEKEAKSFWTIKFAHTPYMLSESR